MTFSPKFLVFPNIFFYFFKTTQSRQNKKNIFCYYKPTPNMCHNINKEIFVLRSRKHFAKILRNFSSKKGIFQTNVTFLASKGRDPLLLTKESLVSGINITLRKYIASTYIPLKLSHSVLRFFLKKKQKETVFG